MTAPISAPTNGGLTNIRSAASSFRTGRGAAAYQRESCGTTLSRTARPDCRTFRGRREVCSSGSLVGDESSLLSFPFPSSPSSSCCPSVCCWSWLSGSPAVVEPSGCCCCCCSSGQPVTHRNALTMAESWLDFVRSSGPWPKAIVLVTTEHCRSWS